MIVVDVNVLAYLLIEGKLTPLARRVLDRDPAWRLPALWSHELCNVLATYVRQRLLAIEEAVRLVEWAGRYLSSMTVGMEPSHVLRVASQYEISAYDAEYIALAQVLGVRCVTEDARLRRAVPDVTLSMSEFCRV